jgi:hypothetical protein
VKDNFGLIDKDMVGAQVNVNRLDVLRSYAVTIKADFGYDDWV